ncbi:hypothetical protein GOODEAATRI_032923 [Goodea atripinnis]|uniref:Uncharacterized protein n=1 Tax=Goodea atripinnis TaxID=208336 RepID=A0ABV0NRQ7_9TELE
MKNMLVKFTCAHSKILSFFRDVYYPEAGSRVIVSVTMGFVGGPKRRQELGSIILSSLQLYSKITKRNKLQELTRVEIQKNLHLQAVQEHGTHGTVEGSDPSCETRNQQRTMKQNQLIY